MSQVVNQFSSDAEVIKPTVSTAKFESQQRLIYITLGVGVCNLCVLVFLAVSVIVTQHQVAQVQTQYGPPVHRALQLMDAVEGFAYSSQRLFSGSIPSLLANFVFMDYGALGNNVSSLALATHKVTCGGQAGGSSAVKQIAFNSARVASVAQKVAYVAASPAYKQLAHELQMERGNDEGSGGLLLDVLDYLPRFITNQTHASDWGHLAKVCNTLVSSVADIDWSGAFSDECTAGGPITTWDANSQVQSVVSVASPVCEHLTYLADVFHRREVETAMRLKKAGKK